MDFARLFYRAYLEASDDVQAVIADMVEIVNDPESDSDEVEAAVDTLVEALFPTTHNGQLGIDISDLRAVQQPSGQKIMAAMDSQESHFAERVSSLMAERQMTQAELANRIGVQQPAVSMMLARKCRPQLATVRKMALALEVDPSELWPQINQTTE